MPDQFDSLEDLFGLAIRKLDESVTRPNILNLGEKEYPEQDRFFKSQKMGRFLSGGNRGGKTDAIVIDGVLTALNQHTWRPRPTAWGRGAVQLRYVVPDVSMGINQTMVPKFQRWVPEDKLKGGSWDKAWDNNDHILTLVNGSTIDFVTHGMLLLKLGSVPRHGVYFDEEPPQDVFNETLVRLIDFEGYWAIAATPTRGMTWTHDLLWEPAQDLRDEKSEWIDTFTLDAAMNPFNLATPEAMRRYTVGMSEEERRIRMSGEFVARSGLIFPNFSEELNVVHPQIPPKEWAWYSSVDVGWNNPTAWLWHAVSPRGDIITFAEHYGDHMTVAMHSEIVKEKERAWRRIPDFRTGDPAMKQVDGKQGTSYLSEYASNDINIGVEGIPRQVSIGIEKMQQYLQPRSDSRWGEGRPKWVITSDCPNFIREMRRLRWKTYESDRRAYDENKLEEVHKKNDHTFDSARYFATMMPDLRPDAGTIANQNSPVPTTVDFGALMQMSIDREVEFAAIKAGEQDWSSPEFYEAPISEGDFGW